MEGARAPSATVAACRSRLERLCAHVGVSASAASPASGIKREATSMFGADEFSGAKIVDEYDCMYGIW